ncbi:tetratricopeptide repeat protein [Nodularia chucula]|uniref:tetratricopeptide repeat protein n=1 Tax=Nodularia chucula TaxID=3093667 RepID=UPI0039C7356B
MIVALIKTIFYGLISLIIITPMIVIVGMFAGLPPVFSFIFVIFAHFLAFYYSYLEFKKEEDAKRNIYLISKENSKITKNILKEPNNLELYIQRASNFKELKRYSEAIQDCDYVVRRNPRNLDAYWILIDSYILSQDYENAIKNCYKALDINQSCYEIYKKIKTVKCKKGDYKSAIEDLKNFINLDNSNDLINKATAYQEIGDIFYHKLNDEENALLNYTKSVELDPNNLQSLYHRDICFRSINKLDSTKKDFAKKINNSIKLSKQKHEIDNNDFDVEAIYNYRYESDFIYWCERTGYEPDDAGSYDAWSEEKNSDFINDDDDE